MSKSSNGKGRRGNKQGYAIVIQPEKLFSVLRFSHPGVRNYLNR
jgi:hypothetical protein